MVKMGQVLLKLDDEHEKMLRKLSEYEFEGKKGALKKVIEKALENYAEKVFKKQEKLKALKELDRIVDRNSGKLKTGYKFKREDAYEDRANGL